MRACALPALGRATHTLHCPLPLGPRLAALGAVVQHWVQHPTDTHAQGCRKGRKLVRGPGTRVLSVWGLQTAGQQPNRLKPVVRPRLLLGTVPPPMLLRPAQGRSLTTEEEFGWLEISVGFAGKLRLRVGNPVQEKAPEKGPRGGLCPPPSCCLKCTLTIWGLCSCPV